MGRHLVFWKYEEGVYLDNQKVYQRLCDQEEIDGLATLSMDEILEKINHVFSGYSKPDDSNFESSKGSFTVYTTNQSVIFDCSFGLPIAELNKIIDIMLAFDCPCYDPQIVTRFDGRTQQQSAKEKLKDLDMLMAQKLEALGFKRRKKFWYQRMKGECLQHILLTESKVPGKDQYWILLHFGFTYKAFSEVMLYLQGYRFDKDSRTVQNNIINLMKAKDNLHFNLYLSDTSNTEEVAGYLTGLLDRYAAPLWEANDTFDKFISFYENEKKTLGFPEEEWFYLTLALLKDPDSYKDVLEKYKSVFELPRNKRFGDIESRILRYIENGGIPE